MISAFPLSVSSYFVIDSFPLAVCKFGRARYCRSFRDHGADYGKCPSKKETYFGYKIHAMITLEGYITTFEITPASTDDREGLKDIVEGIVVKLFVTLVAKNPLDCCLKSIGAVRFYQWCFAPLRDHAIDKNSHPRC